MATRLYFSTTAADVSPIANGTWNYTSESSNKKLQNIKSNTALAIGTQIGPWTAGNAALDRYYVSKPLTSAQTVSGTVKCQLMTREYATNDNSTSRLEVYIVNKAGSSVTGTCLVVGQYGPATEYINNASHQNKAFCDGDTITSVNANAGDRIVVAIGHSDASGSTPEASCKFGDPTATSDLPENESQTTDGVGWFEFSATLTFADQVSGTSAGSASSTTGTLRGTGKISGTSAGSASSTTGTLRGTGKISGTSVGSASSTTGTIRGTGKISGTSAGSASSTTGTLIGKGLASGTSVGSASSTTGTLVGTGKISGTSAGAGDASGTAIVIMLASGTSAGSSSSTTGTLTGTGHISGMSIGTASSTIGTLRGTGHCSGTSSGYSSLTGILRGLGLISGHSDGHGDASGTGYTSGGGGGILIDIDGSCSGQSGSNANMEYKSGVAKTVFSGILR